MAGRPALLGHEAEHQRRVQQRGVGRREVPGEQHVRLVAVRHTRHRHPQQARDDPVPHVVQVGDPAGQVLPGRGEQRPVGGEGVVHAALGAAADRDPAGHVGHQLRVLRHQRLGLQHGLGLAARQVPAGVQVRGNGLDGCLGAGLLARSVLGRDLGGRGLQHRGAHVPHLADRDSVADTHASQRLLHVFLRERGGPAGYRCVPGRPDRSGGAGVSCERGEVSSS